MLPQIFTPEEMVSRQPAGQRHVANSKIRTVWIIGNHKRSILRSQEVRSAGAGHRGHRKVARQTRRGTAFPRDRRAEAGMKTDERAAADRNPRWSTGHHIVIPRPVIPLIMPDGADGGELVRDGCESL